MYLQTILLSMLAQRALKQYFDENKELKKCVPQSYLTTASELVSELYDKQFLSGCIKGYGWWILFKFPGKFQKMFNSEP